MTYWTSKGKYLTSIRQILLKIPGAFQVQVPLAYIITSLLYLSAPESWASSMSWYNVMSGTQMSWGETWMDTNEFFNPILTRLLGDP